MSWMAEPDLVYLLVLLPLIGAAIVFLSKNMAPSPVRSILKAISIGLGSILPWAVLAIAAGELSRGGEIEGITGGWSAVIGIAFTFDGLSLVLSLMIFTLIPAAILYAASSGPRDALFLGVTLVLEAALAAAVITGDIFTFFVCLEVIGICSYVLVASKGTLGSMYAAFYYLMASAVVMVFYLIGVYGLYRATGALSFEGISSVLETEAGISPLVGISLASILAAVLMRSAVVPLHPWLPSAHALAPHPVSAVLSSVLIKVPLFVISRLIFSVDVAGEWGAMLSIVGAVGAVAAAFIALLQRDAKKLLAYSSVSQIGYILAAWGASMNGQGAVATLLFTASLVYSLAHAAAKSSLFFCVGTAIDITGNRSLSAQTPAVGASVADASSGGEALPRASLGFTTRLLFVLAAASLAAVPGMASFTFKYALTAKLDNQLVYTLLTIASLGTAAAVFRLASFFLPGKTASENAEKADADQPSKPSPAVGSARILVQLLMSLLLFGVLFFPGRIFNAVHHVLVPGRYAQGMPSGDFQPYSWDNLLKTGLTLAAGLLLAFLASRPAVERRMVQIRRMRLGFSHQLMFFVLFAALLALVTSA